MDLFPLPVLTVFLATCAINPSSQFCNAVQPECISKQIQRICETSETNTSLAVRSYRDVDHTDTVQLQDNLPYTRQVSALARIFFGEGETPQPRKGYHFPSGDPWETAA